MPTPKKPTNPNQTLALTAVLLLILGLGSSYLYFAPQLKETRKSYEQSQADLREVNRDIITLTGAQSELATAKNSLAAKGVDFDRPPLVFPINEDVPALYIQMENMMQIAKAIGLTTPSYQIAAPTAQTTQATIPVTVSASGSYGAIKLFIDSLELNIRPLAITTLTIGQGSTNVPGTYSLSVTAATFAKTLSDSYKPKN